MTPHIKLVLNDLVADKLDAFLVTSRPNISYLTGVKSSDSYLLVTTRNKPFYFTDSRYIEEVKCCLKGIKIIRADGDFYEKLAAICGDLRLKNVGFEEKFLNYHAYRQIKKLSSKTINYLPTSGIIEKYREVKSIEEINKIKEAAKITQKTFNHIQKRLKPGKTELEIAGELEFFIRKNAADGPAFDLIVAFGPNSSYPHHVPGRKKLAKNDIVLIDIGVDYFSYKSDLTRVFFLGKITPLAKRIYEIVKEAQSRAIRAIKPAEKTSRIDAVARQYIASKGYAEFFRHNLGHGIGLDVHENPLISSRQTRELKQGMVFTIEPGIYLPGKFGIRLEEMVMVNKEGAQVISGTSN